MRDSPLPRCAHRETGFDLTEREVAATFQLLCKVMASIDVEFRLGHLSTVSFPSIFDSFASLQRELLIL